LLAFLLIEIIINNSGFRKGLWAAWVIFTDHFAVLAILGFLFAAIQYLLSIALGMTTTLVQYHFDWTALSKLDYINPALSFTGSYGYLLIYKVLGAVFGMYGTAVYTVAYVKYEALRTSAISQLPRNDRLR
jgi:hypothetical protein